MDLASVELFHASVSPTEYSLKQQLDLANMTIVELQNAIENGNVNFIFNHFFSVIYYFKEFKHYFLLMNQ